MDNKKLNNKDLNGVSGGSSTLEKYLKSLVEKDKDKTMVDYGTGVALDLNPSVDYDENGNLIVIKREKDSETTEQYDLFMNNQKTQE